MVPGRGLEPPLPKKLAPKASVSTSFTTPANFKNSYQQKECIKSKTMSQKDYYKNKFDKTRFIYYYTKPLK